MPVTDLDLLSDDGLIELGAQLEADLADAKKRHGELVGKMTAERRPLMKPGLKLAINAAVGIAGVSLAPVTMGWSLMLSVVGGAVTISDALDLTSDIARISAARREMVRSRRSLEEIRAGLADVNAALTRRLVQAAILRLARPLLLPPSPRPA